VFVGTIERARLRECGVEPRLFGELLAGGARGLGFGVTASAAAMKPARRSASDGLAAIGAASLMT
jgi:hypothetical protein